MLRFSASDVKEFQFLPLPAGFSSDYARRSASALPRIIIKHGGLPCTAMIAEVLR